MPFTPDPVSNFSDAGLGPPTYDVEPSLEAVVLDNPPQPRDKWPYEEGEEVPVDEIRPGTEGGWTVILESEEPGTFWYTEALNVRRWVYRDDELLEEAKEHLKIAGELINEAGREVPGAVTDANEARRKVEESVRENKPSWAYA